MEEPVVVIVTIIQIIIVDVTTIIKTVKKMKFCVKRHEVTKKIFQSKFKTGGEIYDRRGNDDWGRGGSSRGGSTNGDKSDPPLRQNDRWQEPDKRENYGGKWKDDRGGYSRGKIDPAET